MRRVGIVVFALVLFVGPVWAAPSGETPPILIKNAEQADLEGFWNLVQVQTMDHSVKKGMPYQRWNYRKDGVVKHIASTKPITEKDIKMNDKFPPNTHYTVNDSILTLTYSDSAMTVSMRAFIVVQTDAKRMLKDPRKPGDLILAAYRKDPDTPDVMWILRRPQ